MTTRLMTPAPGPNQGPAEGFTLIELLVVIAIIGVLCALLFGALGGVRGKSDQLRSANNLRQIGIGFRLYEADSDGRLPNRANPQAAAPGDGEAAKTKWPALIARYLKDVRVYADPGDSENYLRTANQALKDPVSQDSNNTSYIYNGFNDLGTYDEPTMEIVLARFDHQADTILLGIPKSGDTNFFMDFQENNNLNILNLTAFTNGSNYLFLDGSVRFITADDYRRIVNGKRSGDLSWLADKTATNVIR